MSALVFMDTETTGLTLDDDIWEFAAIRREPDGRETQYHLFLDHDKAKCRALPDEFLRDHQARWNPDLAATNLRLAAECIAGLFIDRPHVVGAVPNFDTERLALLLRRYGCEPGWHYHLIDVENLAVGFLAGLAARGDLDVGLAMQDPPWDSDALSRAVGVDPDQFARHTAMGDAEWARAIYDTILPT
jgi:hypothetical protein